jgi:hypothetical protein
LHDIGLCKFEKEQELISLKKKNTITREKIMTKSMAELLRIACKANKLGDSGSSTVLLKRLLSAGAKGGAIAKKSAAPKKQGKKPAKNKNVNVKKKPGPKKKSVAPLFKGVKNGGERLSAGAYFKQVAGGKLYNCEPQLIRQPDGSMVLKKIKMCDDAWGGRCAKWVKA